MNNIILSKFYKDTDLVIEDLGKINLFVGFHTNLDKMWRGFVQLPDNRFFIRERYFELGDSEDNLVLHYSKFEGLWQTIFHNTKQTKLIELYKTQSIDAIRAFTKVAREENEENIRLFRFLKKDEELKVYKSDLEILEISAERNGELR